MSKLPVNSSDSPAETKQEPEQVSEVQACEWCKTLPETSRIPSAPEIQSVRCSNSYCPVRQCGWLAIGKWNGTRGIRKDLTASVSPDSRDLDPLEFWCDLAEVLGHTRPATADIPALVSEVKDRLGAHSSVSPEQLRAAAEEIQNALRATPFNSDASRVIAVVAILERRLGSGPPKRPKIVCLCGSTRFYKEFQRANYEETMKGHIVLSVGFYMHESEAAHGEKWGCTPEQKIALDALHFHKIELADEVLVLDVNGYIGESTRNEIDHAAALAKRVRYRSQEIGVSTRPAGEGEGKNATIES